MSIVGGAGGWRMTGYLHSAKMRAVNGVLDKGLYGIVIALFF